MTRPTFLALAATNSAQGGVTGAAIGTEVVLDILLPYCRIELIELKTNGLGNLAAVTPLERLRSAVGATIMSVDLLTRLAIRGLQRAKVDYVYFLPAASKMGMMRNAVTVFVIRQLFRNAALVFHIRNGNYFASMTGLMAYLHRYVNKQANNILVLSPSLLPEDPAACGFDLQKVCILPNTIDAALIPEQVPVKPSPPRPLKVLYLSNFIKEKGYLALLEAGEILCQRGMGDQFSFTFRGKWLSAEDRCAFENRAAELSVHGLNVDIGDTVVERCEVQRLHSQHHIFCLPTCYAAEAQPRSILEAMANGCAIVATRYRSIPDQVKSGETGFLIDGQDPHRLADTLQECARADIAGMGQAGAELFQQDFSPQSIKSQLLEALSLPGPMDADLPRGADV
ncbi:glycosyltransferase family 4 protein [Ruegeria atlantica]|uniref:glycosyltransferase family 4 protein n=1 Tax=Ruegeria atlantica TaxID=81569 RepID=UPI00147FF671|nr:glycosyltransferase family 4 protein [Ruegeria atlantica]